MYVLNRRGDESDARTNRVINTNLPNSECNDRAKTGRPDDTAGWECKK